MSRTPPAQRVIVEVVYKADSDVARPQGTVTERKGSRPKL